ncbi:MAG: N-acetylmuramoyl-L-alanine amidase, partial [Planctomycetes bacterium]|nr:N-acetylmuramoyl-L-alanine amidase [Planctomycetota bacterium]
MTHRRMRGSELGWVISGLIVAAASAAAQGQIPGQSIEEFKDSLDPRVFQTGGYGPWAAPLGPVFDSAAATYNVPRELLMTLGFLGSAFENRGDQPTIEYGYGVMALRQNAWGGDSLTVAAQLLHTTSETVKTDPNLNIMGAAAVLNAWAGEAGIERGALDAWLPVIVRYAGLADAQSNQIFAGEVYSHLKKGLGVTNSYGETFSFPVQKFELDPDTLMPPPGGIILSPDYGPAAWDPAPTCNYSTSSSTKDTIVIHTAEGSYAGTISWIKNCSSNVSAHYVSAYDGRLTQMVREYQIAWHVSCYNSRSVGIEHEGFASASSHPQTQYDASGDLSRDICDAWGIPKQKRTVGPGIIGHIDVTNCCCGTHTDPGNGWDWNYYIARVNGTPPTPAWAASYVNQSYPSSMSAGSTAIVWAEFRNDGTGHWRHAETRLGTQGPQDRSSPFCTPGNWVSCNRPTDVDQSDVAQGQVGRFTFILTAPATPGTYVEKYKPVREGITWFGPEITWTITVTASTGNLSGTVTNASTAAAVAGATVNLTGVGSTTTNSSGAYSFSNVTAGTYNISVSATGFNGAADSVTINAGSTTTKNFSLTPSDTQAPTTPTLLTATATGPTSVQLTWTASSDNVGVAAYDVRRNGGVIGSTSGTSYTDNTAGPLTTYTYQVRARDAVPNYSGWSNSLEATTPPNPPQPTLVFSDGFNGNLNNWTQQTQNYDYSTTVNHGTYAGAGAAYCAAGQSDQMFRQFSRPFAQGKVWG